MTSHRIGLLGSGIGSSLSPALHQAEAAAHGLTDYRYELLDLLTLHRRTDEAAAVLREAVEAGFTGFNVTFPCKQAVIEGLDEVDPEAAALGAVNTVVVDAHGRLVGHNTDHSGFGSALRAGLPTADLSMVVLCGAGGAGSAVAHALAASGVRHLVVADIDHERARELAQEVGRQHPDTLTEGIDASEAATHLRGATGIVNASPVGMEGFPGTPVDVAALRPEQWVADIVYRPLRTDLLESAARLGCRTLDGAQMLVAQAADTFRLVTDLEPDRNRMHRHLHDLLAARAAVAS